MCGLGDLPATSNSNAGTGPISLLLAWPGFFAEAAFFAASADTEGSAVNSSDASGAPLAAARRTESIGESSSPDTLARGRFPSLATGVRTPQRLALSETQAT